MPEFTLGELAALVGGRVEGDAARRVTGAQPPAAAGAGDITFAFQTKALREAAASAAGAVVVAEGAAVPGHDLLVCRHPNVALVKILEAFHPPRVPAAGVHASAVVAADAVLGPGVHVGPRAVVDERVTLGAGVVIGAGAYVGPDSKIGERTVIHPGAILYALTTVGRDCAIHSGVVVGADGFGYTRAGGRHMKIPQVGGVEIGDDVEIGANSCIDRGTMTPTRIGSGTKIDNLVQIGHNCEIGQRVIVCGQCALAGSTIVEDDDVLAGQVGVAGHLRIGKGSMAAAGTGVTSDVEPGSRVAGHPPMPLEDWRRSQAALRHLPELRSLVRQMQKRIEELERSAGVEAKPAASDEATA